MDKTINIDIKANTTGVKSLKQELRETVQQLQQLEVGTAEFDRLNSRASEIRDKMAEVNEQIAVFATGSKYEKVTNSFGEMSAGLASMDFDRVVQGANLFAKNAKAITFKDAIGSVKQLGQTFLTVGKAILTNPLFLIAGVIILIITAIVKLLDKMGWLKKIFEAVGSVIDWVIQQFKDLLDWLGLTDFAMEDFAENMIAQNERIIESNTRRSDELVSSLDFEIKKRQIMGEDTAKLERKRLRVIQETAKQEIKARMAIMIASAKLHGQDSDEYKEAIKNVEEAKKAYLNAAREVVLFDTKQKADEIKRNEEQNAKIRERNKAAAQKSKQDKEKALAEARRLEESELAKLAEYQKQAVKFLADSERTQQETDLENVKAKYAEQIALATKYGQDLTNINEAMLNEINNINLTYADKIKQDKERELEEENQKLQARKQREIEYSEWLKTFETDERERKKNELDTVEQEQKSKLEAFRNEGIITEQEYQDQLAEIEKARIDGLAEYDKQKANEAMKAKLDAAEQYAKAGTDLLTALGDLAVATAKKDVQSQEKAARQKFKVDKAAALVTAAINTALAITKAAPNPATIAFAAATGLASIATIASKQFNSGASGATPTVSSATPSSSSEAQASANPSFNLFGTGGQQNNVNAGGNSITVNAIVSETEVTSTQNRVEQIKQSSQL